MRVSSGFEPAFLLGLESHGGSGGAAMEDGRNGEAGDKRVGDEIKGGGFFVFSCRRVFSRRPRLTRLWRERDESMRGALERSRENRRDGVAVPVAACHMEARGSIMKCGSHGPFGPPAGARVGLQGEPLCSLLA